MCSVIKFQGKFKQCSKGSLQHMLVMFWVELSTFYVLSKVCKVLLDKNGFSFHSFVKALEKIKSTYPSLSIGHYCVSPNGNAVRL